MKHWRCWLNGHAFETVEEDYPNLGIYVKKRCRRCPHAQAELTEAGVAAIVPLIRRWQESEAIRRELRIP